MGDCKSFMYIKIYVLYVYEKKLLVKNSVHLCTCMLEKGLKEIGDFQRKGLVHPYFNLMCELNSRTAYSHLQLVPNHCFKICHHMTVTSLLM